MIDRLNLHLVNQIAKRHLLKLKVKPDPDMLYIYQLMEWALDNQVPLQAGRWKDYEMESHDLSGITGRPDMSNRPTASTGRPDKGRPERGSEVDQSEGAGEIEAGSGSGVRTAPTTITETVDGTRPGRIEESEITVEQIEQQVQEEEEPGSIYAKYRPQKVKIPGAKPHPGDLVQSAAMAAVEPPAPTYVPNLPKNIIEEGKPF